MSTSKVWVSKAYLFGTESVDSDLRVFAGPVGDDCEATHARKRHVGHVCEDFFDQLVAFDVPDGHLSFGGAADDEAAAEREVAFHAVFIEPPQVPGCDVLLAGWHVEEPFPESHEERDVGQAA